MMDTETELERAEITLEAVKALKREGHLVLDQSIRAAERRVEDVRDRARRINRPSNFLELRP